MIILLLFIVLLDLPVLLVGNRSVFYKRKTTQNKLTMRTLSVRGDLRQKVRFLLGSVFQLWKLQ